MVSVSAPPHSSGINMPQQPSSPSFFSWSIGNFSARSYSRRMGRISVSMNWRTVSRMRIWSLLSEKSIERCRSDASTERRAKAAAKKAGLASRRAKRDLSAPGRLRRFAPYDGGRADFRGRQLFVVGFLLFLGVFQAVANFGFFAGFHFD